MTSFTATDGVPEDLQAVDTRAALERRFDQVLAANKFALMRLAGSYTDSASDRADLLEEKTRNGI